MNPDTNPYLMRHAIRTLAEQLLAAGVTTVSVQHLLDIVNTVDDMEQGVTDDTAVN
jgi:site-specific recombinase XerD